MRIYFSTIILFVVFALGVKAQNIVTDTVSKHMHISVLLPFYTSKYNPDSEQILNTSFPEEVKMATEYYWGLKLGLDSVKKAGHDVTLHIYDTGDDTNKVNKILLSSFILTSDIILVASNEMGDPYPVLNRMECFAQRTHIPMFEVANINNFVPSHIDSTFYILNATWNTHIHTLLDFAVSKKWPFKILIVNARDKDSINVLSYERACKDFNLDYDTINYTADSLFKHITQKLSLNDTNIIILPFTSEEVVKSVLLDMQNIPKEYKYIILGMPDWRWFKYNSQSFVLPSNVYITASSWYIRSSAVYKRLDAQYHKKVNRNITDNVILGYEQMLWLSHLYFTHPDSINSFVSQKVFTGLANKYKILKILNDEGMCKYSKNANVYIIKPYYTGFKKVR